MRVFQLHGKRLESGFSLIQVSILLTVASLVMVSMLPGNEAGNINSKNLTTMQKMQKIEQATTGFIAAYGRRPCPASGQYAVDAANFGIEAANNGSCTGGTPAVPLTSGNVAQGTVPTKTLNLPDEYAFDDWGRQITYVVDKRATAPASCATLQNYPSNNGTGGITVKDGTSGSTIASVMALYISHGPDGHGGFPIQGSTAANRINIGSTDTDTLNNASVDTNFNASVDAVYIQKEKTATYDDITYFAQYQKNKCCIGLSCYSQAGFRVDGTTSGLGSGSNLASGDINGDGYKDLIIGAPASGTGTVYVVFGKSGGFANPLPLNTLNGTNGFSISDSPWNTNIADKIAVADVNGDGYDDILMANSYEVYALFGHANPWSSSVSIGTTDGTNGTDIYNSGVRLYNVASGDVNGDGIADIIAIAPFANSGKGYAYVLFGHTQASRAWAGTTDFTTEADGTKGIRLNGPFADSSLGWSNYYGGTAATGDVNGDGIADILISDVVGSGGKGVIYVVFGHTGSWTANHNVSLDAMSTSQGAYIYGVDDGTTYAKGAYVGMTLAVGDTNGDGTKEIITSSRIPYFGSAGGNSGSTIIIPVGASFWGSASYSIKTLFSSGSAIHIDGDVYDPEDFGWATIGDFNKDGYDDILIACSMCNPAPNMPNGGAYLIWGHSGTWSNWDLAATPLNGTNGMYIQCFENTSKTCFSGAAFGDFNNDGIKDLALGAAGANPSAVSGAGYTYVMFGKTSSWGNPYSLNTIY